MIIEELLHASAPVDVERLRAQQDRELGERSLSNLAAYDERAGLPPRVTWPIPPTAEEIAQARGFAIELSVAMCGINLPSRR